MFSLSLNFNLNSSIVFNKFSINSCPCFSYISTANSNEFRSKYEGLDDSKNLNILNIFFSSTLLPLICNIDACVKAGKVL